MFLTALEQLKTYCLFGILLLYVFMNADIIIVDMKDVSQIKKMRTTVRWSVFSFLMKLFK